MGNETARSRRASAAGWKKAARHLKKALLPALLSAYVLASFLFSFISGKKSRRILFAALLIAALGGAALIFLLRGEPPDPFDGLLAEGKWEAAQEMLAARAEAGAASADSDRRLLLGALVESGQYEKALSLIGGFSSADEETQLLIDAARAGRAEEMYEMREYESAAWLFSLVSNETGEARYRDCLCAMAVEAYMRGNDEEAERLLKSAGNPADHIVRAAHDAAQNAIEAEKILKTDLFRPENLRALP